MFVQNSKFLGFDAVAAWWPESVQSVRSFLDQTRIVILWQCPKVMVEELQPYVFRTRPFWTPLVDLSLSEDVLWRRLDRTSCRQEISRARKMGATILHNEETESARLLINESIRRLGYRPELGPALRDALALPARWIGVIGSVRHTAPHLAALRALGVTDADIGRVHRPVGLNIGSHTPAEIAVATLAGLIADRNERPGGFAW